jgi:hypothetical protein
LAPGYRQSENVVTRQVAGETLLVPIRGDLAGIQRIFALDEVARFIWERIDGCIEVAALATQVVAAFDVNEEQAEEDIRGFIAELYAAGLITELS